MYSWIRNYQLPDDQTTVFLLISAQGLFIKMLINWEISYFEFFFIPRPHQAVSNAKRMLKGVGGTSTKDWKKKMMLEKGNVRPFKKLGVRVGVMMPIGMCKQLIIMPLPPLPLPLPPPLPFYSSNTSPSSNLEVVMHFHIPRCHYDGVPRKAKFVFQQESK